MPPCCGLYRKIACVGHENLGRHESASVFGCTKKTARVSKERRAAIAGKIIIVVLTFGLDDVQQAAKGSRRSGGHVVISGLHEYPYRAALFAVCLDAADLGDYKKPFLLFGLTFIKKSGSQG